MEQRYLCEITDNMLNPAQKIYYKIEPLRGYCKNSETNSVQADMMYELLSEIEDMQADLIKAIDNYSTEIGHELVK